MAIVLELVGARAVRDSTGRIARFELRPLEELAGRPRVDVLCNLSGIFRDSFQNVVELLGACPVSLSLSSCPSPTPPLTLGHGEGC